MSEAARLAFDDLRVGQRAAFEARVTASDLDRYIALSGDASPLHAERDFARARGFPGRVVHGAYLAALVSRLVGMHLPGRDALVQSMDLAFRAPLTVDAAVRVEGAVDQLSEAVRSAVMKVAITDLADGRTVASATVQVGFTREAA